MNDKFETGVHSVTGIATRIRSLESDTELLIVAPNAEALIRYGEDHLLSLNPDKFGCVSVQLQKAEGGQA